MRNFLSKVRSYSTFYCTSVSPKLCLIMDKIRNRVFEWQYFGLLSRSWIPFGKVSFFLLKIKIGSGIFHKISTYSLAYCWRRSSGVTPSTVKTKPQPSNSTGSRIKSCRDLQRSIRQNLKWIKRWTIDERTTDTAWRVPSSAPALKMVNRKDYWVKWNCCRKKDENQRSKKKCYSILVEGLPQEILVYNNTPCI